MEVFVLVIETTCVVVTGAISVKLLMDVSVTVESCVVTLLGKNR